MKFLHLTFLTLRFITWHLYFRWSLITYQINVEKKTGSVVKMHDCRRRPWIRRNILHVRRGDGNMNYFPLDVLVHWGVIKHHPVLEPYVFTTNVQETTDEDPTH